MRRECRQRFIGHRLQRIPLVSNPGMHHATCVTHLPWCMSGSLTRGGGEKVPGILSACATRTITYQVRGPCHTVWSQTSNEHLICTNTSVMLNILVWHITLQLRDGALNHQPRDCLLNCLFRRRSKKYQKRRVTGLCVWNLPVIDVFTAQRASNAENVSIWWRHHYLCTTVRLTVSGGGGGGVGGVGDLAI